jgi:hypothetical protein
MLTRYNKGLNKINSFIWPRSVASLNLTIIVSCVIALIVVVLSAPTMWGLTQSYEDIIVGSITWTNHNKSADYMLVVLFFVVFSGSWVIIKRLFDKWFPGQPIRTDKAKVLSVPRFIMMGMVVFCLIVLLISGTWPLWESIVGIALLVGFVILKKKKKDHVSAIVIVLSAFFMWFSLLSLLQLISFFDPDILVNVQAMNEQWLLFASLSACLATAFVLNRIIGHAGLYVAQFMLPLMFVSPFKGIYESEGQNQLLHVTHSTIVFVSVLIALLLAMNIWKIVNYVRSGRRITSYNEHISLVSLLAISTFLVSQFPPYSVFAMDDFHLGEIILPWQQFVDKGQTMYTEFVSIQGLMGVSYGGLNELFFAGTAASFPMAINLFKIIIALITVWLISCKFGKAWTIPFVMISVPTYDRFFLIVPILLVVFLRDKFRSAMVWASVWFVLSLLHFLYNPSTGLALAVTTAPYVIYEVARYLQKCKWHKRAIIVVGGTLVGWSLSLVAIWPIISGAIQFIVENGQSNTTAYGVGILQNYLVPEWFPKWFATERLNYILWELTRIGAWGLGILTAIYLAAYLYISKADQYGRHILLILLSAGFIGLLIPYSMGRIDPGNLSRSGAVSMLTWGFVMPVIVLSLRKNLNQVLVLMVPAGIAFQVALSYTPPVELITKAVSAVHVPVGTEYIEGEKVGLPRMGDGFVPSDRYEEIRRFNSALREFIGEDDRYLDLTNRSFLYYLTDSRVPVPYSADYVAANARMQKRQIEKLIQDPPKLVFIAPGIRHDGGNASLRSYRIYKWLLAQNYKFVHYNGFSFLLREDIARDKERLLQSAIVSAFTLPPIQDWKDLHATEYDKVINEGNVTITKSTEGWIHLYADVKAVDYSNVYKYQILMETGVEGGSYAYFDYLDKESHSIGNYTSPHFTNGIVLAENLSPPEGTDVIRFGIVINQHATGVYGFGDISLAPVGASMQGEHYDYDVAGKKGVFYHPYLDYIPDAWGGSYAKLANRFIDYGYSGRSGFMQLQEEGFDGSGFYKIWKLKKPINGLQNDFLLFIMNGEVERNLSAQVMWTTVGEPFKTERSIAFGMKDSERALLPMGSDPEYLLSGDIDRIMLYSNSEINISNISFLQLIE